MKHSIKKIIENAYEQSGDIEFVYKGKRGVLVPYTNTDNMQFEAFLGYDKDNCSPAFNDINELFDYPMFEGKTFREIINEIDFEW